MVTGMGFASQNRFYVVFVGPITVKSAYCRIYAGSSLYLEGPQVLGRRVSKMSLECLFTVSLAGSGVCIGGVRILRSCKKTS